MHVFLNIKVIFYKVDYCTHLLHTQANTVEYSFLIVRSNSIPWNHAPLIKGAKSYPSRTG